MRRARHGPKARKTQRYQGKRGEQSRAITTSAKQTAHDDSEIIAPVAIAGFFNMTSRAASATGMRPNSAYHDQAR
jgi:hypothetical protein